MHHERRVVEPGEDALRSVLKKPAASLVGLIVARDEFAQRGVSKPLLLDAPVAAPVERQPAVHRRHVRPAGHAAGDDLVHRGYNLPQEEAWAQTTRRRAHISRGPGSRITPPTCRPTSRCP